MNLNTLVNIGSVGADVKTITGKSDDALKASGIGAWIQSVTGEVPLVEEMPGNRARLYMSPQQAKAMENWFDSLTRKPAQPQSLKVDLAPALTPFIMKKAVPAGLGILALGIVAGYIIGRI